MFKSLMLIVILGMNFTYAANTKEKLDAATKTNLINMYKQYESLHNAFFHYDAAKVEQEAKKLNKKMSLVKNPEIAKMLSFSSKKLQEIKSNKDRKSNNQNMHLVSMALIHVLKSYDISDNYSSFTCPMVKQKWIQNTSKNKEVENPYAGSMPHCGRAE